MLISESVYRFNTYKLQHVPVASTGTFIHDSSKTDSGVFLEYVFGRLFQTSLLHIRNLTCCFLCLIHHK